jgi:hypothetical protein
MTLGLTNLPASFQEFIHDRLYPFLDIFCTAFLDNMLINSDNLTGHKDYVRVVMTSLKQAGLFLTAEKCEFHNKEIKYRGLIVGVNGIMIVPEKVHVLEN